MLLEIKIGDEWNLENSEVFHGQDLLYLVSVEGLGVRVWELGLSASVLAQPTTPL